MKRVLVVDDDENIRVALKHSLVRDGYHVTLAVGGRVAQHLIAAEAFDAVISDIRMPDGDGLSLLRFVRSQRPELPIILMTAFADLTEAQDAHSLGANDFIGKPFEKADLLSALNACLAPKESSPDHRTPVAPDYCKIAIGDLVCGKTTRCDLYIRLGESKYVKIAHKGEELPVDQIAKYKQKKLLYLYMCKEDLAAYLGMNMALAVSVRNSDTISSSRKLQFMKHTMDVVLESVYCSDVDKEGFENAKTVLETTISILSGDDLAFRLLEMLNSHGDYLYAHSLGVSLYSSMIVRQLEWHSPQTQFKASVGGLMHDIGKKEIDRAILAKKRGDLTVEELRIYESHCTRGLEILGEVRSVPSDILQIVLQHHENYLGQGFPSGLKRQRTHPIARVVAIANAFCNFSIASPTSIGMNAKDSLERMLTLYAPTLDPKMLRAFVKLFNVELSQSAVDGVAYE